MLGNIARAFLMASVVGITCCVLFSHAAYGQSPPQISWVDIPESNADYPALAGTIDSYEDLGTNSEDAGLTPEDIEHCEEVGFTGEMSRHETTNAQYARYLNDALASGDIKVEGNQVVGASGEYSGRNYYRLDGRGWTGMGKPSGGPTDAGKSRINYEDGEFTVESGFENHPVTYVSWYGATTFAQRYGWRLPTEWEWESVANYKDYRTYATGDSVVSDSGDAPGDGIAREYDGRWYLANYRSYGGRFHDRGSIPAEEEGTTPVGHFGYYGYGLADMSGNVWEWTSSAGMLPETRMLRGGRWDNRGSIRLSVTPPVVRALHRNSRDPSGQTNGRGFRVCR